MRVIHSYLHPPPNTRGGGGATGTRILGPPLRESSAPLADHRKRLNWGGQVKHPLGGNDKSTEQRLKIAKSDSFRKNSTI